MEYNNILKCFPSNLYRDIENIIQSNLKIKDEIEEIRIRINLPVILKLTTDEVIIEHIITREEINNIIQRICENSLYSYQSQISSGYITIVGGNRVGIVGSAVIKDEKVINLNYISGLNFRISKQVINCSNSIVEYILDRNNNNILNTLIVSSPGVGKTTLIKDIIRKISNGMDIGKASEFRGIPVTVVDERGEIGACYKGIPQNDLGIRTDIFDDMPKAIGMKMAIRAMSPKVIVADEIGSFEDAEAIKYAVCCGIKGVFTAHGNTINDLKINPALNDLIESKIFEIILFLKKRNKESILFDVYRLDSSKQKYLLIN